MSARIDALLKQLQGKAPHEAVATLPQDIKTQGLNFITSNEYVGDKIQQIKKELPHLERRVELVLRGVKYRVERSGNTAENPSVGDILQKLACLLSGMAVVKRVKHGAPGKVSKTVLNDVNLAFYPGEIHLVLGPPGSGKSSLLRHIQGLVKADKGHVIEGEVLFNGHQCDGKNFYLPKVVSYAEQHERHVARMTVEDTFYFAFDCMEGGTHMRPGIEEMHSPSQKELIEWMDKVKFKANMVMKSLGILHIKDTIVGDASVRGVSGGERRRVTCGEMLLGPQDINLLDSVSTGLDSSTTLDLVSTFKVASEAFNKVMVVALLQPPPEVYDLFQKVTVLAEGSVIYSGVREGVLPYFESIGFRCPERKDEADFVVEIPTDQGADYIIPGFEDGETRAPRTAAEFAQRWNESEMGKELLAAVKGTVPLDSQWPEDQCREFALPWLGHFKICLAKHINLFRKDVAYIKSRVLQSIGMGLIVGSIFWQLEAREFNATFGVLFFSLLFLAFGGMANIPTVVQGRAVFYKQRDQGFFPTSADVIAQTVVQSSMQVFEAVLFSPIIYFMCGFSTESPAHFFIFFIVVLAINLELGQFFRFLPAIAPNFQAAQGLGGLCLVFLVLFCGFLVPANAIPDFYIFIYWVNPLSWAFRAVVVNEFTTAEYTDACANPLEQPNFPACVSLSAAVLNAYGFETERVWIGYGILFLLAQFMITALATSAALHYLRYSAADQAPIEGSIEQKNSASRWTRSVSPSALPCPALPLTHIIVHSFLGGRCIPVNFTFSDIHYSVPHPSGDGKLELLNGLSGYCLPGTMTALMGSSGAGKTTLLDVLAGRKTGGEISGDVRLNGFPKDQKTFARVAGYVEQMDNHSAAVTVKEAVSFSAKMRLDSAEWDSEKRGVFVDSILQMLELRVVADTQVGDDDSGGLSLEQAKRLTIAVEMAGNPSLLFLDEPTSGLDARGAQVVMKAIRKVAGTGRTVICTIHQPSTYLFEMFDSLLLLKKGGQTVYFGELAGVHSSTLISYMSALPAVKPIPPNYNPATWMLEVIGAGTAGLTDTQAFATAYNLSEMKLESDARLQEISSPRAGEKQISFDNVFAVDGQAQLKALTIRAFQQYWLRRRSPNYSFARLMVSIIQAVIFGSCFVGEEFEDATDVVARMGVMYMSLTFISVVSFQSCLPFYYKERVVFYREMAARMYSPGPYAAAYGIAEIPYLFASVTLFVVIFYFMAGLEAEAAKFFWYWLFFFLNVSFMTFLGQATSMLIGDIKTAQTLGGVINSLLSLFGGFLISPGLLPTYWLFAYWLCPLHYALEGLITTQFHDNIELVVAPTGGQVPINAFVDDFFGGEWSYSNRHANIGALFVFLALARIAFLYGCVNVRHIVR
ncbi:unnamed protein product [Chrysoparadoxa australica]